ncbi:hypothetical protein ES705_27899 [subsurface metagenome]
MVVLTEMPHTAIIDGLKGQIDFYHWKGLPIARKWPNSPGKIRSPAVMAQWPSWKYAAQEWVKLSQVVRDAYITLSTNSGLSGRDMQMRAYLQGLYRYPLE